MGAFKPQRNEPLYSNTVIATLAVDGWTVTFGTARMGLGGLRPRPGPLFAVPNATAQQSTASVPITVLLSNGLLLCGFNVHVKGLIVLSRPDRHIGLQATTELLRLKTGAGDGHSINCTSAFVGYASCYRR